MAVAGPGNANPAEHHGSAAAITRPMPIARTAGIASCAVCRSIGTGKGMGAISGTDPGTKKARIGAVVKAGAPPGSPMYQSASAG